MYTPRKWTLAVCAIVVTATFAGCGGDSQPDFQTGGPAISPTGGDSVVESDSQAVDGGEVADPIANADEPRTRWRALLVGCTDYYHLSDDADLRGCANDVQLMRDVLVDHFNVHDDQVRMLIEEEGADAPPTKANIQGELKRLAENTTPGDSVLLLFSGHGCQQPDDDPQNPADVEPDGLDEVFLPADTKPPANPDDDALQNVLRDDELRAALAEIRKTGAFVWVIVDACHSGSAARGSEVYRQISPDRFFSAEALQRARSRAPRNRGADDSADRQDLGDEVVAEGGFVAIYAAQPHEPTIELHLPPDDPHGEWRGLLTFTIARTLLASRGSITYRELTQRVHSHYVAGLGRLGPTPLIEGNGQDRLVLGDGTERPSASFILSTRDDVVWTINAGKLHGAWRGSVFSVHPPPGQQDSDAPLGHVRVTTAQLARSDVKPIAFDGVPRNGDLPLGAECRPVALAQAAVSLRVGVSATANEEQSKSLAVSLKAISAELSSISVVEDSSRAEWIVGVDESGRAALAPVAGWPFGSSDSGVAVGPGGVAESREWMAESLGRIARATGLLKVCGARSRRSPLASSSACIVSAALKHHDESNDRKLEWSTQGLRLNDKDVVILEVTNRSRFAVDYSVLFVDSQFGVHVLFPEPGLVVDNRIAPGQTANVGPLEIDGSTLGIEHLVVIASRAEGLPLDWSWLAQSALESSTTRAGAAQLSFESELGALLHDSMFTGASANRGLRVIKADAVATRVITWQTNGKSP